MKILGSALKTLKNINILDLNFGSNWCLDDGFEALIEGIEDYH